MLPSDRPSRSFQLLSIWISPFVAKESPGAHQRTDRHVKGSVALEGVSHSALQKSENLGVSGNRRAPGEAVDTRKLAGRSVVAQGGVQSINFAKCGVKIWTALFGLSAYRYTVNIVPMAWCEADSNCEL